MIHTQTDSELYDSEDFLVPGTQRSVIPEIVYDSYPECNFFRETTDIDEDTCRLKLTLISSFLLVVIFSTTAVHNRLKA
jgi:hypothetical protein